MRIVLQRVTEAWVEALFTHFVDSVRGLGVRVETGVFQARMAVHILNDGPVTFILESRRTNPPRGSQACFERSSS